MQFPAGPVVRCDAATLNEFENCLRVRPACLGIAVSADDSLEAMQSEVGSNPLIGHNQSSTESTPSIKSISGGPILPDKILV